MEIKNRFDEVFAIEVEGWCYGIQSYPGELFPGLIHAVVRECAPSFKAAVEHNFVFDILELSKRFSRAAKYLVHEKEICFSVLAQLPNPSHLNEDGQFVLAQIVDQVEQKYGGALERLQRKWAWERRQEAA
ncbi:MAG: hypothetical protein KDD64_13615 [Bdellovibrionales bacterium]|nr:hypothetical protein [Bdellovibrionales bacterium]